MRDFPSIAVKKPATPGTDVSGTIVSVGADVKDWKPSDKVFGVIPAVDVIRKQQGGLAEYALLHYANMFIFFLR